MSGAATYNKVIALTGTIGSGKTSFAQFLKSFGAHIISADELARQVVEKGQPALAEIENAFGKGVMTDRGELNRETLGKLVFNSSEKRKALEAITHPRIRELALQKFNDAIAKNAPLIVYDCPLYFEAGLDALGFRASVVVSTPEEKIIQRLKERNGMTEEEIKKRLRAQLDISQKIRRADFHIENSGSLDELKEKAQTLYQQLAKS